MNNAMSDDTAGFRSLGEFLRAVIAATPRVAPTQYVRPDETDPVHDPILRRVTLWDAVTGETVTVESDDSLWWWTEGNGSCDCNRESFFPEHDSPDTGYCDGSKRYLVVAADPPLDWCVGPNDSYPADLQQRAAQLAAEAARDRR